MSKKRKFYAEYNLRVNGIEYPREYNIVGVRNKDEAETKLRNLVGSDPATELIIKSITPV